VLEATSNAWLLYDQLQPLVAEVVVARLQAVKLIAAARVKTDSRDTIKLARRLSANLIPAVWVPPQEVRELRALVTHRNRLVKPRTQAANRLRSVLQRHTIDAPPGIPFAIRQREWWLALDLPLAEKLRVEAVSELVSNPGRADLGERSRTWPAFAPLTRGSNRCLFWCNCPGWGFFQLCVSWPPLGKLPGFPRPSISWAMPAKAASVHQSGETNRGGHITKEGRSDLHGVMVEAAWVAVEHHPRLPGSV
jgi:transposase